MKAPPSEGDLIEVFEAGDALGHEQRGRRPALVVSVNALHESGFAFMCPITTHSGRMRPKSSLEVMLPAGLKVSGFVMTHQLRSIDWVARECKVVDRVPRAMLIAVRSRLKTLLGA